MVRFFRPGPLGRDCLLGNRHCLLSGGRHLSFSVHLDKGVFRCFHPECGAQGNTLDLWAAYHRLPLGEAARSLAETFALDLTTAEKSVTHNREETREEEPVNRSLSTSLSTR